MARFQTFGHKFETAEERFTQSDQENLDYFDTFRGFSINNTNVTKIFVECTENEDHNNSASADGGLAPRVRARRTLRSDPHRH